MIGNACSHLVLTSYLLGSLLAFAQIAAPDEANVAASGSISSRKNARVIHLKIPAPRGQIVDREGRPFAQNIVAYQLGLQYPKLPSSERAQVLEWAHSKLKVLSNVSRKGLNKSDDELFDHYVNRRWLPLAVTSQFDSDQISIAKRLPNEFVKMPVYRRYYPNFGAASHIIGYTGSVGKLPTGPINYNDPAWEESEGRSGLESIFDKNLQGEPGLRRLIFDEDGTKTLDEEVKRPKPGGTVVTTLNLRWQEYAERVLERSCRRGAFVVIDAITGEVLVMASRPTFDLNSFVPNISSKEYDELRNSPSTPLVGRAFQSAYPPASSFKPLVALAALENKTVTPFQEIFCPAFISFGRIKMYNASRRPEGSIDVKRALARSCNTWFIKVGIDSGPQSFLSLARRFGMGTKSGLPLMGETPGLVPTEEWMLKHEKRNFATGDTGNMAIGQGSILSSPLQVAQAMAGLANGGALPKLHLIRQTQNNLGKVTMSTKPEERQKLVLNKKSLEAVRAGMRAVVSAGYGTGKEAELGYTSVCGKTGTAQWGPKSKNQRLAWFAGFLPYHNPRFAFVALYEGSPGEQISGGKKAAPMVHDFFTGMRSEVEQMLAVPQKAKEIEDEHAPPTASEIYEEDEATPAPVAEEATEDNDGFDPEAEANVKSADKSTEVAPTTDEEGDAIDQSDLPENPPVPEEVKEGN